MSDSSARSAVMLVPNAAAGRATPWTPGQDAILSDAGLARARTAISAWPGYEETPLLSLAGLASAFG
ncbi:MAG: diaminopropionate ammonia-lyase, partial [Alphaproteobacteria bacterium]